MCLLPTRGCRGELARRRGPRLGEDSRAPLAEAYSAGVRHPGQLVDRLLRFYVPPRRVFLVEEIRLPPQVLVVVCQEEGLLCEELEDWAWVRGGIGSRWVRRSQDELLAAAMSTEPRIFSCWCSVSGGAEQSGNLPPMLSGAAFALIVCLQAPEKTRKNEAPHTGLTASGVPLSVGAMQPRALPRTPPFVTEAMTLF